MSVVCLQRNLCCQPELVLLLATVPGRVTAPWRPSAAGFENGDTRSRRRRTTHHLVGGGQRENRFPSSFDNPQGLSWSFSALLRARLAKNHGGVIVEAREKAGNGESSGSRNDDAVKNVPEKKLSIPPALYRPLSFFDLQAAVRGLDPGKRWIYGLPFLAVLAGMAWFRNIGLSGLGGNAEPVFAEAARQMIVTGDFVTPHFNGVPQFDQPILLYWLMAFSVKLFGSADWAFRLPSCLCATGLLMGLFLTVNSFGVHLSPDMGIKAKEMQLDVGDRFFLPAIVTAASFATNLQVVTFGSASLSDMLLTSTIGASLLSFFWGYAGREHKPAKHSWGYVLAAVFAGLAFLTKGPVGVLFPFRHAYVPAFCSVQESWKMSL